MKKIYSILTSILLLALVSSNIQAQCSYNNSLYATYSAPTIIGASVGGGDCTYAGEFNRITGLQAGSTYRISTCNTTDVADTRITVYAQGGSGGALSFNDDYCGLLSRLDFTPTADGTYDILLDATGPNNTCISIAECIELTITLIGTSSSTSYCIPTYTIGTSNGDFINGVSLGSINNQNTGSISGAAYSDFTNLSSSLAVSTSYTLAIKNNPDFSELVTAWIDYNQDFEFSVDENLGQIGIAANATGNITFTTPASPLSGNTRMRVRMVYSVPVSGGSIDPCLESSFGETEDYTVTFPTDPPGPPAGLTFSTSCALSTSIQDNACPNYTSASISVSGLTSLGTNHIISSAAIIIEHPMAADLDLYLESPSGQQVLLSSDNGGAGSDYGIYSSSSCTQVSRFIMNATTSITSATAPFVGSFIPEGNLADFNAGTNPNGSWKLKACDDMAGDIGTIRYFEIAFELNATEVPACADAYGIVDGSTNVELNQELSWTAGSGNPTSYDVYFGADASSLVLVSDNQTGTTFTPSNLAANTTYAYQVVPANSAGDAVGCPVISFTTVADGSVTISQGNGSVTACSGNFFDSGGVNGNYSNSELSALTIFPETAGSAVQVDFTSFNLDIGFDFLAVADGVDEFAPVLGFYSGTTSPGTLTATNSAGALTFLFSSDDVANFDGWAATISCVPLSSVPACASNLAPVDGSVSASVTSQISWDAVSGATGYDVYFGTSASPSIVASNISATTFDPGALLNATTYYYNVVPVNANGSATDCPILSFTTAAAPGQVILMQNGSITTCDAAFFDSGNANADYSNDESYTLTILPESANSAVQVVFNSFDSEADFDVLNVYKGSDASGTLIQSLSGSITQPVSIVSTSTDGALTFVFSSDFQIASSGWDASISCVELVLAPGCVTLNAPADASTDVALDATLSWTAGTGATADSYDVYFGTDANPLNNTAVNQTATSFSPSNLLNNTTYFWSVIAMNAAGEATNCSSNSFTTVDLPLEAPSCVTLNAPADASTDVALDAILSWTAGTGATADSYDVFIGSSANDLVLVSDNQTGSTFTPTLTYATTYFWSVTANNAGGSSSNCVVNSFTTENEPVLPPTCVVLASPADASTDVALDAILSWTAGTGATADSYDVFIGSSATDLVLVSDNQTGSTFIPSLNYATTYFWSVTANNSGGSSTNCAVNSFTTVSEVILPPTCVTLTNPADASIGIALDATLSWTAGIGSTPDLYNVYFGTDAINLALVSENQVASSYSPVGLTNNTTYYWSVVAVNNFGESTNCTVNSFTTIDNTVLPPSCVTLDSPADLGTDVSIDATLSWTAASGETPISYDVFIGSSPSDLVIVSLNQTATSFTPTLNYATTYYWSVTANNAGGSSTNCDVFSFTTEAEVILAPACPVLVSPSNLAIDVAIDASLTWTSGLGSAATSYDVFVGLAADALTLVSDNQTATSYSPAGLLNNTTYYWSVVANNDGGSSADCDVFSFTTEAEVILAPACPVLVSPLNLAIDVAIDASLTWTSGLGSAATSYDVFVGLAADALTLVSDNQTATSYSPAGLLNNTTYYWSVVANNDGGSSADCSVNSFTTIDIILETPSCVTLNSPTDLATGIALDAALTWTVGVGAIPDSYDVYFGTDVNPLNNTPVNQTATSYSPSNLQNATTYYWSVIAMNASGVAINCSVYNFTTIDLSVEAPNCVTLNIPADAALDVALNTTLSWTAGSGTAADSYDVYFGTDANPLNNSPINQTALTFSPSNLQNATTYYWLVIARNAGGEAINCSTFSFTTVAAELNYCVAENIGIGAALDCANLGQEFINVATIGTIVNSSGCTVEPAYTDFTSLSTTAIQGNTVPASFLIGNYFTTDRIIVWGDWNQDGDFSDVGEQSLNTTAPGAGTISGNIAVPAGASLGATRIRVRLFFGTPTIFDPCGNPSNGYGETEDYTIIVEPLTEVPLCAVNLVPSNAAVDVSANEVVLSWTDGGGSATYDVYFGTTSGSLVLVSDDQVGTSFDPGTLDLSTTYYWQVIPTNSIGTNSACLETSFTTSGNVDVIMTNGSATTCAANFFDSGNIFGNYVNNENFTFTFFPDQPGSSIQAVFNSFNTELNYDGLYVYNGPDTNSPLIPSPSAPTFFLPIAGAWQGNIAIGPFTSSHPSGALTFVFLSDGSVLRSGWDATISCVDATQLPNCAIITSGPANGAIGVCVNEAVFTWTSGLGVPANTYDVYFDAGTGPILISDDQTSTTFDIGLLDTNTTYTIQIVPSNANGEAVGCETITFTTGTCLNYCDAGSSICDEYIANVQMGNINNATDCTVGGYNDYTSISADVYVGTPSPITISNGPDTYTGDQCGIWVDWNHDGDFNDANETIAVTGTPGVGPYTALVNAPVDAFIGTTTMRVRITFTGIVDPCGTTTFGEVEDYSINVFGPLACPFPNNILASETTTTSSILTWDEVTSAVEYQIRYRLASEPTTVATWSAPLVVAAPLTFSFLENLVTCEDYILQIGSVCELGTEATFSSNILFGTRCIECTSDLTPEGEDCGQDANGGCNSGVFGSIACGETICGTSFFNGTTRDTDWFSFDVATDGIYTVNVLAEFDGTVIFADASDCNNILTPSQANFFAGEAITLSSSLTVGTYSVIIVPSFEQPVFACTDFNGYTLTLSSGDTQIAPVADVCETAAPFNLFATPVGGIWTGTGVSATGTFDPSITGIGSFELTYEAVGTGCASTATITVNVIAAPVVDFVGLAASYCSSVENVVLTGIPAGGTFSINSSTPGAINGNVFNPSLLDAGTYDITYVANTGGSCAGTITQSVIITDGPTASIDNLAAATCAQDASITLTGTPASGTFSGNGVVGSTFDPSVSGTGPQTITYTISEAGNVCPGIATAVIQVNPSPVVTLSGVSGDYCLNSGLITMIGTPALGSFLIDGVASGSTFDAATAGLGSHVLRYEFNNGTCTGFSEVTVNVVENLTVTFNTVASPICSSSDAVVLTSTPDGATFSGPGVVGVNLFDPSLAGVGTHTLTATYANGNCTATATQSVTVNPSPFAGFNYGANGATVSFTNSSVNATTYSWDFGDGSAFSTETNPSHTYTTNGSFTIVLTASSPGCGSTTYTAQLDLSVGIGSIDGVDMIQLYPNPTSGNVTLAFNSLNQQSFNVRITDATGRLIQTESMTNYIGKFNKTYDLTENAKGVYLFTVASEKGSINFRVVRD